MGIRHAAERGVCLEHPQNRGFDDRCNLNVSQLADIKGAVAGANDAGDAPTYFPRPVTSTTTRRFFARPAAVALSAIGLSSPIPITSILLASTPSSTK